MPYVQTVLADNPVNYWRLADGVSVILHDIGSLPHHLVVTLSAAVLNGGYSGIEAGGLSVYANQIADSDGDAVTSTANRSVEMWCYQLATRGGSEALLYAHGNAVANGSFQMFILATGQVLFRAALAVAIDPAILAVRAWHHLVGTYDGALTKLYVDGNLKATGASVGGSAVDNTVEIGALSGGLEPYHGFLAEIAEYNFALSAAQVLAHFNAVTQPVPSPISGFISGGLTTSIAPSAELDLIYAAVHHVFPTT